jgi:hypothetical protein
MKTIERIAGLLGLILLLMFFAPYIHKLSQIDITLILLGGASLVAYDFWTSHRE